DAHVRVLQGEHVVHAVAGHRDDVPPLLQRPHHLALLAGRDAPEHGARLDGGAEGADVAAGEVPGREPAVRGRHPRPAGQRGPRACSDRIISRFWRGVTRPNTVRDATVSPRASTSSRGRSLASSPPSAPGTPARRATADTVAGWSPETTLSCTPWRAKNSRVSG